MHSYNKQLSFELKKSADPAKAIAMKAYMKNQFQFLGIPTQERRAILKNHLKENVVINKQDLEAIVKELWMMDEREFQYCSIEILLYHRQLWAEDTIETIEYCLINKSWWDTVDPLSYDCAGTYFKMFDNIKSVTGRWNRSGNFWLQRSSLLFQKSYKQQTDTALLANYILHLASSKEFFVQKAIGWILREYAKTNAAWVSAFVNEHTLAPLSKREALKHL